MARFTDGNKTAEIEMRYWLGEPRWWSEDISNDILIDPSFRYDKELDTYVVDDIDALVLYAEDWKNGEGDFFADQESPDFDPAERDVEVTYCQAIAA